MAKVVYKKNSPYWSTQTVGPFLDVLNYRSISKYSDDVAYKIDKIYEHRPDLLAYDLYKDSGLWWVFRARNPNTLEDPLLDFRAGVTIYIPKKEHLAKDLGI
jgi:hypothetical protein